MFILTSCDNRIKQAQLVDTGEKCWVNTILYSKGDTILLQYSSYTLKWSVADNWSLKTDSNYVFADNYKKAVIL
jgi:hypothetical protein